ncbi:MAG TPA: hypothetical protein PLZ93_06120 [Nocardioides sp.]|uniref:hypothetical protein n=1 Tax=uncultured Nocardioides sp. TaxID=198441 RepID=UPI0026219F38|nr:hypothetical protein [uncultured Nocardioides sp.]HRD62118.1 hypothetical protein [Nocardioides sp.]HRI95167.1 hypothetical protein [Nocardioides sp.]HRK45941.1 hypothetical protein [Nocardioides sp.]
MAEKTDAAAEASGRSGSPGRGAITINRLREVLAQIVWLVFLVAALFLAVGALLIALDANRDNALVNFVLEGANRVDLGIFSKDNGVKEFTGNNAETKNALFNWGLGAIVWLIVGRMLERLIRP